MKKTDSLSLQINNRLLVTVLVGGLIASLLVVTALFSFIKTDIDYSQTLKQAEDLQAGALKFNTAIVSEMLNTRAYLISGNEGAVTRRRLAHAEADRDLADLKQLLDGRSTLDAPTLAVLLDLHRQYDSVAERLISLRQAGQTEEALQLFDAQSDPLVLSIQSASLALQNELQQGIRELNESYSRQTSQKIWLLVGLFVVSAAICAIFLLWRVAPLLNALGFFETSLANAADTQVFQPVEKLPAWNLPLPPLMDAYNRLGRILVESNATILKHVRHFNHDSNSLLASIQGY
ncbi:MAG: CHASE3 domain-containing protein, partial [Anaerolineaceae bacterium]|nr:CHASE3 domain-containing protein [Anaerolineaceae bacterium]